MLGLVLFFACGQIALAQYATTKPILEPTVFALGAISTGDYECVPEFAPDGKTLYFVKSTPDANFWTIVFSRIENSKWTKPQVAPEWRGPSHMADAPRTGQILIVEATVPGVSREQIERSL